MRNEAGSVVYIGGLEDVDGGGIEDAFSSDRDNAFGAMDQWCGTGDPLVLHNARESLFHLAEIFPACCVSA